MKNTLVNYEALLQLLDYIYKSSHYRKKIAKWDVSAIKKPVDQLKDRLRYSMSEVRQFEIPINYDSMPWLAEILLKKQAEAGGQISYAFSPTRAERKIFKRRKHIPVSEWAEKNRVLTMSAMPGPWRNEITPHLVGIMNAMGHPYVREIIICKSPQTGGSECVHNFIGSRIDMAPGPVLYAYPDERIGKENMQDRIQPMIKSSPRLRTYMTGEADDFGLHRINLIHMPIYLAWARSASSMSNKPIRYAVVEEEDKYPETAGSKETSPKLLIEARLITYRRFNMEKIIRISTPTTEGNFIWQALMKEAEVIFDMWARCPECGRDQKMILKNIRVPENNHNANQIESKELAWYQCVHCPAKWYDHQRDRAIRVDGWRERVPEDSTRTPLSLDKYLDTYRPRKIGFHLPSWVSPFVSLSKIMADWFRAQADKTKLKDFFNKHMAEPWRQYTGDRKEDYILKLKDDRPRGLVPSRDVISGVTAIVDTQDRGFYYEIRAWGYGFAQESWQIREGFTDTFASLEQLLWTDEYLDSAKNKYLVRITLIDAMGHRTAEVYDWCRRNRGRVIPLQGVEKMNAPHAFTKIDCYPGTNKPIPGGLQLLRVNTNHYKDLLAAKLEINPADPGAWHMHSEMSKDWALMMVSEFVNDKGLWECKVGAANHAWDISGYGLAAADLIGLKYRARSATQTGGPAAGKKPQGVVRSKWMANGRT